MGEDTTVFYNHSQTATSVYSTPFPAKLEPSADSEMVPYTLSNTDQLYCAEPDTMLHMSTTTDKAGAVEDRFDDYIQGRPLHHMPSISTTCTSDSFQSNLTSPDATDVYTAELNTADANMFDWSNSSTSHFHWPPNHNLATPPLESPVNFHHLGYAGQIPQSLERQPSFPTSLQNTANYYPLTPATRRPSQAALSQYQTYTTTAPEMLQSLSSGGNSQSSTTPTMQSPPLSSTPRPTKKGSISTDIPTGRNRGHSLNSDINDPVPSLRDSARRRSSLSASQHHLSRSPNRAHHRRASALPTPSFAVPLSQDLFDDKKPGRLQIKRSKSANTILTNPSPEAVENDNESSGEDRPDDLAKTKAARAQSEHRRRVELKESFERLRLALGVPQPRAGKKDLVEQAISALEYYKRKENDMLQEITYLRSTQQKWSEDMMGEEMQL